MTKSLRGIRAWTGVAGAVALLVLGAATLAPSHSLAAGQAATMGEASATAHPANADASAAGKAAVDAANDGPAELSPTLRKEFVLTDERIAQANEANAACVTCHVWEQADDGAARADADNAGVVDSGAAAIEADAPADDPTCLFDAHADRGVSCVDCHTDAAKLDDVHAKADGKKAPSRLRATKVADEACLACHVDRPALAEALPEVAIVDGKGTAVNPHALPDFSDHQKITCVQCHEVHEPTDLAQDAKGTCLTCHHADVFECGTCH